MAFGWLLVVRFHVQALAAVATATLLVASLSGAPGVLAAASPAPRPGPAAAPASEPQAPAGLEPAQEFTLGSMGIGSQSIQAASGSVEVLLPAPSGPLAPSGSFVRVFFGHSPLLDPATSSLTLAVNGQPLSSVRLDGSNADGSVFEARVAASTLRGDRPNLLQARFELKVSGAPATGDSAAYARLDPQTLLHYQIYGPPGSRPPPRLESYPFPFATRAGDSGLGFVLPQPAAGADLRTALRLAADLGRRAFTQQVRPEIVTTGSDAWLRSAGKPALLIGTLGRLPAAQRVLQAAGFSGSASGWSAPDGQQLQPGDGVLAAVTSPFDGQSPILLVTGFTDDGLARGAAALLDPGAALPSGGYAILPREAGTETARATVPAESWPAPGTGLPLGDLATASAASGGSGSRQLLLPFTAPAVDPARSGSLELRVRGASPGLALNGQALPDQPPDATTRDRTLQQAFSGSLLHPGLNVLGVRLPAAGAAAPASVLGGLLRLPSAPPLDAALELLPEPLLSAPGGLVVTLARLDDGVLSAAALAMAALGSRGGSPRSLNVVEASALDPRSLGLAGLLAIGGSGGSRQLERLRRQLPAALQDSAELSRTSGGATALVVEQELPAAAPASPDPRFQLWIEGSSPQLLTAATGLLYSHPLPGRAVSLDAGGRLRPLAAQPGDAGPGTRRPPPPPQLRLLLPLLAVMAAAATLLGLGWQLRAPAETAW
jgi:hypothetical protein